MKSVVVAHGELKDNDILKEECKDADIILCADGAAEYLYRNEILPDYLIGDFDSIDMDIYNYFKSMNVKIIDYPCDKDYTDTEICVNKAIELKSDVICILSGIGNRIDHSLGNIGLLHIIGSHNIKGYIACDTSYIYLCNNYLEIYGHAGDTISILPFKEDAKGLESTGLRFTLDNTDISFGKPIGVSNVMTQNSCSIRIEKGEVLVIKQKID